MLAEHCLCIGHFAPAGVELRISGIGAALLADGLQAFGQNGQAEELVFLGFDHARQIGAFQIIGGERVVGGAYAVLQRQVKAGGRFARARHAH